MNCQSCENSSGTLPINERASFITPNDIGVGVEFRNAMQSDQNFTVSGLRYPITFTKNQAQKAGLSKGEYSINGTINNETGESLKADNLIVPVVVNGKTYPVKVATFDVSPPYETKDGLVVSDYKADVIVDEVPINSAVPVAPIVWGVSAAVGLGAAYMFIDRLDKFTSKASGQILTLAGVVAAVYAIKAGKK